MKVFVVLLVVCAAGVYCDDTYTTKFDNFNLDDVLNNDRLLTNYVDCGVEEGNCTPEGKELKSHLKEAIQTNCAKCNDKQKAGAKKVIKFLHEKKPELFERLLKFYDPTGEYKAKYEKEWLA